MSENTNLGDYWTQQNSAPVASSKTHLNIESIEGVEPLDAQFGVADPKTVPDALYGPLFGRHAPTSDEPEQAEGYPAKVTPLHTYAILDAAKVPGLPELLAASGLKHRSLFKGDAYDELKDVAPWIVRLEAGNSFTRNLFTRSDAPWHLWDKEPGIYLRSRGTLDEMWGHFRKFTKVKDEQGKWFYFRFWEPGEFGETVVQDGASRLFHPSKGERVSAIYALTRRKTYAVHPHISKPPEAQTFVLMNSHRKSFDAHTENRFAQDFAAVLSASAPSHVEMFGISGEPSIAAMVSLIMDHLKPLGFTKRSDLGRLASCALFYGTHFLHDPRVAGLAQLHLSNVRDMPGLRAKRFEEALHKAVPLNLVAEKDGLSFALPHLRFALEAKALPQHWLSQLYTPALGFTGGDMAQHFARLCLSQQSKHGIDDPERQKAHYVMSVLYTPYFVDDPLHEALSSIFAKKDDFKENLLRELERRFDVLEKI